MSRLPVVHMVATGALEIAFEEHGRRDGEAVILLHGFPYDPRCFDAMAPELAAAGHRVIVPYLRGFGGTRFLSPDTPRSGQQAALGSDLLQLMDALGIGRAALVGYDWGGRAACVVAALWPERVSALVTGGGYNIQNIAASARPAPAEQEHRFWYQYYLHTERGRAGLEADRDGFCKLLWRLWSPTWDFSDETFARSAASFRNADFVDVVVQSYRHRFGYAAGDPGLDAIEAQLALSPPIPVATIAIWGADDGVGAPAAVDGQAARFTGPYQRRVVPGLGHNMAQEAPEETLRALRDVRGL